MAVIGVQRIREFEYDKISLVGREGFNVYFDDLGDNYTSTKALQASSAVDPNTALAIPQKGQEMFTGSGITVTGISVGPFQGQNAWWRVDVTYSVDSSEALPTATFSQEPWLEPTQYFYTSTNTREPVTVDEEGRAVVPSSGGTFQKPPERDKAVEVITIKKREPRGGFDPSVRYGYLNALNDSAEFIEGNVYTKETLLLRKWDASPRTAKITSANGTISTEFYWDVTIVIHVNRDGWKTRILDRDIFWADKANNKKLAAGVRGSRTLQPVPLNGLGQRIFDANGGILNEPTTGTNTDLHAGLPPLEFEKLSNDRGVNLLYTFRKALPYSKLGI